MSSLQPPPQRVLVVSMRFLGDALLSTPLAAAIKREWPDCSVDMLVFKGCEAILEGNPHIDHVLTVEERPSKREQWRQLRKLWNRYDFAFITQTGTRPFLYGWAAGKRSVAPVATEKGKSWWKQMLLWRHIVWNVGGPRFLENEQLLAAVGLATAPPPTAPSAGCSAHELGARLGIDLSRDYAVLHPSPRWRYKQWTDAGWQALARHLQDAGLQVLATGGPGPQEKEYVERIFGGMAGNGLHLLPGRLSLAESADLIRHARLYVGVDTATTHVAAATGTPTVAIFGPTDPAVWGPWPADGGAAYQRVASVQKRGNSHLIQNPAHACQPCQKEGCAQRRESESECLEDLASDRVIQQVNEALRQGSARVS